MINLKPVIKLIILFILYLPFSDTLEVCAQHVGNEILSNDTYIRIRNDQRIIEKSVLIQVNNKQSNWLGEIEIPYDKNDELEILEAIILDKNGNKVRSLTRKEITTRSNLSSGTFYEDDFVKEFELIWNDYPYQVKYKYRLKSEKFVFITRWYPILYSNVYTRNSSLTVDLPTDYGVRMDYPATFKYDKEILNRGKNELHKWSISNLKTNKKELFSPSYRDYIPSVSIVPNQFIYGVFGKTDSWKTYGDWHVRLNQGLDKLTLSEELKVDNLIKGMTDKREIIKTLYHYMQDYTRYINVAIDVGGLQPYPASYVCEKKYGDCKALTIYMKALLNHAGIESNYTTIYAGDNSIEINETFPSQQFNHVILSIPMESDTIWLENTSSTLPYNYLGTFTQNRLGLLVNENNSQLIGTPKLTSDDVLNITNYHYSIDKNGNGHVLIKKTLRGSEFEKYRYAEKDLKIKEMEDLIKNDIQIKNMDLLSWSFDSLARDVTYSQVNIDANVSKQVRKLGNLLVFTPPPIEKFKFEKPEKRTKAVKINYPINRKDTIIYQLPYINDYVIELPKSISLESQYGQFTVDIQRHENTLKMTRHFLLKDGYYPLEEYKSFYDFISSIKKLNKKNVIILKTISK